MDDRRYPPPLQGGMRAFDATDRWKSDIQQFRSMRDVSHYQVSNYACCEACEAHPAFIPIDVDITYPLPGCTREDGCRCMLLPVLNWLYFDGERDAIDLAMEEREERVAQFREEMRRQAIKDKIIGDFYEASDEAKGWYRKRNDEPYALNRAIAAAKRQVELSAAFIDQRREDYGDDLHLPRHYGFERLAILAEQEGRYADGVELCQRAQSEGWAGDWQKRIDRLRSKI